MRRQAQRGKGQQRSGLLLFLASVLLALLVATVGCRASQGSGGGGSASSQAVASSSSASAQADTHMLDVTGRYYRVEEVVLYLDEYGELPHNFITKRQARQLGWSGGSVERFRPGAAIGGDVFGNREGMLPQMRGATYRECDIDTQGKESRGAKRLIYTDDGNPADGCAPYYYTTDHYDSFVGVTVEGGKVTFDD